MKKLLPALLFICTLQSGAQETAPASKDTSHWNTSGFIGLTGSRTEVSNWQGGGQANTALTGIGNYEATWKRDEFEFWTTKLDGQFGLLRQGYGKNFRKNNDQIFALSKYNTKAFSKHTFYAAQVDYRSQFAPGYKYVADTISGRAVSDFNSPGYVQLALGIDYKPYDFFSIMIAPVAAKLTLVNRQYLADEGAYGMEKAVYDSNGNMVTPGKKRRFEGGGRVIVKFKKDIAKNLNLDSYLDLFSNYAHNPGNIDVIFNNLVTYKIGKFFTASIICQMLYDDDVTIKRTGLVDKSQEFEGPRLQVLTTFGVGIGYKF